MSNLHFIKIPSLFFNSTTADILRSKFGDAIDLIPLRLCYIQIERFNELGHDEGVHLDYILSYSRKVGIRDESLKGTLTLLADAGWCTVDESNYIKITYITNDLERYISTCAKRSKIAQEREKKRKKKDNGSDVLSTSCAQPVHNLISSTLILSKSNLNSESNSNPSNHQESTTTGARETGSETSSSKLPTDEDFLGWDDPPQPAVATPPPEPPKPTKTPKLGSAKPSGASRIERKVAAIERLIQETSKPLWFTGSEPINELRRFLEICQAKKKIPKMASTVGGWIAQYQALDEFLFSVKESIRNEWCTLLPRSDILKKMGRWKFGKEVVQQRYVQPRPPPQRPPERERTPEEKEQDRIAAEEARKKLHDLVNMKNLANSLDMNRFLKSKMN